MQFLYQLSELFREAVHGALEAREQVEGDDDGEAYAGDGREQVLFHGVCLLLRQAARRRLCGRLLP